MIRRAGDPSDAHSRAALEELCSTYWEPLYAYVRRQGYAESEAQDLTQEFLGRLVARNNFAQCDPGLGKFRAFLLASMNHFLAKEWRRNSALKRGAGQALLSLDTALAERWLDRHSNTEPSPEKTFDRRWAETVLERAGRRLRDEFEREGRLAVFGELSRFLSAPAGAGDYASAAARLQMTESAVAKAVERLRRRFREAVRAEIARTVSRPEEVEDELRYLLEILA